MDRAPGPWDDPPPRTWRWFETLSFSVLASLVLWALAVLAIRAL